jgi:hypothetical protein
MNSMAFSLLANSNPEVDKNQEMELTIGSMSFYVRPAGSTRLSDLVKLGPSASKAKTITMSGSSVGSYIMTEVIPGGAYRLQDKKIGKDESNPWNSEQLRWFYA